MPVGWEQGFNFGPHVDLLDEAKDNPRRTFDTRGSKVSLVGWSLSGLHAREPAVWWPG